MRLEKDPAFGDWVGWVGCLSVTLACNAIGCSDGDSLQGQGGVDSGATSKDVEGALDTAFDAITSDAFDATTKTDTATDGPVTDAATDPPLPAGAILLHDFDIPTAVPLIEAYSQMWVPSPWLVDHNGPASPRGGSGNTVLRHIVEDGKVFTPVYSTKTFTYARSEIALAGPKVFAAGKVYMIEWKGYFPQALPPPEPELADWQKVFNAIFQIHNDNDASPYYAFAIDTLSKQVVVAAPGGLVPVMAYSALGTSSHVFRLTYKVTSGTDGFVRADIDGVNRFTRTGASTTPTPGADYVKFGLYDWGHALVSPTKASRARSFEMVTQRFRVYQLP